MKASPMSSGRGAAAASAKPRDTVMPRSPSPSAPSAAFNSAAAASTAGAMRARAAAMSRLVRTPEPAGSVSSISGFPECAIAGRGQQALDLAVEAAERQGDPGHLHRGGVAPDERHDDRD